MIFVLPGVNTRPCCFWAVGPGVQLLWPYSWRWSGEVYGAAQVQGLCCCFRGWKAHPRVGKAKTHLDIRVLTEKFVPQITGILVVLFCLTNPPFLPASLDLLCISSSKGKALPPSILLC